MFYGNTHRVHGNVLLVDDQSHAALAVRASGAVEPHGGLVLDRDGVGRDLALVGAGIDGHRARVDTVVSVHGGADVVEGGLRDGVGASPELELHHVANSGLDLLGPVLQTGGIVDGVPADGDDVDINGCSGC